jgi:putative transcriptional regulator
MAVVVRRTLAEIRRNPGRINRTKVDAATEADIRRHMIEDGEDPTAPLPRNPTVLIVPEAVRAKLGMSQSEFAAAIGVPVATLRNWEQGRRQLDPAVQALMRLIWANPRVALRALARTRAAS